MPLKTHLDEQPTLNLTSMIDVVFLLIIFFMVGTRFSSVESKVDVKLPQVAGAGKGSSKPAKVVINVLSDGQVLLDQKPVTLDELRAELAAIRGRSAESSVVVRGDAQGALQHVAGVLATCREAGISDLGLSVKLAQKKR